MSSRRQTRHQTLSDSDWSKTQSGNDTIVIENGYALFNCPDNSNIFITQSSVMTIGKTYTASFDIISIDSGGGGDFLVSIRSSKFRGGLGEFPLGLDSMLSMAFVFKCAAHRVSVSNLYHIIL